MKNFRNVEVAQQLVKRESDYTRSKVMEERSIMGAV